MPAKVAHDVREYSRFRYIGGDRSVDFANTTASSGHEVAGLASYDVLLEWALGGGVITPGVAASLRRTSEDYPARAVRVLAEALELRQTIVRIFAKVARNEIADSEIAELNATWLARSLTELAIVRDESRTLSLGWPRAGDALEGPLWIVSHAAALLLTSGDASLIRRCDAPDCGWFFVDRSRNGLRRWCEMETCGTRMKSARRAARTRATRTSS